MECGKEKENLTNQNLPVEPVQRACHATELSTFRAGVYSSNCPACDLNQHVCASVAPAPRVTLLNPKYQEVTRQGGQGDWGLACKCMEEVQEDGEGEPAERQKPER